MIELLENRIAPASLVGNVLTYTDIDGDLVKISFSHATMAAGDFVFSNGGVDATTTTHQSLTSISMTGHAGGGFTLTAKQQNGNGDGRANIGTITSQNTSLGSISIDGDLSIGSFTSSSAVLPAIKSLTVHSLGADVTTSNAKVEFQGIQNLTVKTDISNVEVLLDASPVVTKAITIGGDLIGGNFVGSGNITTNAPVTALKIGGSVIGGGVTSAGELEIKAAGLHALTIGGSLVSGGVVPENNGRIDILAGDPAAVIKIGGDLTGVLTFAIAKSLTVVGSVAGSSTSGTGLILGTQSLGSLTLGSIIGGSTFNSSISNSGDVQVTGNLSSVKVTGGIYAGEVVGQNATISNDGILAVNGTVGTATIGTIQGTSTHAAYFSITGSNGNPNAVKTLTVTHSVSYGSILAGYGSNLGTPTDIDAGFGSIVIGGNLSASYIIAGANVGSDGVAGTGDDVNVSHSATIGSVKIAGEFNGVAGSGTGYDIYAGVLDKLQVGSAIYSHTALQAVVDFDAIGTAFAQSVA